VTKGGATLMSLSYGYNAGAGQMGSGSTPGNSGQVVSVTGTINGQNRNQTFSYDNVKRLVTATGWGAWARKFDYDKLGNRTAVWDAVSGGNPLQNTVIQQVAGIKTNRIESVNGTAFSYDASGNVTGDGARTYTYDAVSRLVSVGEPGSESYGYDAGNRRVKKVAGGVVTHYIWEGNAVIAEYERGGATQATGIRYYHPDRQSTRMITNSAGAVVGTTDQLPFGEEIAASGEVEKHKFGSYERDSSGLDYAVNRHYDPRQGRFNQVDPLGMGAASLADPQSLNLYGYVRSDPVNSADPTGLRMELLGCSAQYSSCGGGGDFGSGYVGTPFDSDSYIFGGYGDVPRALVDGLRKFDERVANARADKGFRTNEEIEADAVQQEKRERQRRARLVPPGGVLLSPEVIAAAAAIVVGIIVAIYMASTIFGPHQSETTEIEIREEKTDKDLYVFEKILVRKKDPNGKGDVTLDQDDNVANQSGKEFPEGKSFYSDKDKAPLTGIWYRIPAGSTLPVGTQMIADGRDVNPRSPHPEGHHTLYPTVKMPYDVFNTLVVGFIQTNFVETGRKKKK
jgi:RHS repeat-associated protein